MLGLPISNRAAWRGAPFPSWPEATLAAEIAHLGLAGASFAAFFRVAVAALGPEVGNEGAEGFVGGFVAEEILHVVADGGEEAGEEFAIGGEAEALAVAAKGFGDRGNDADLGAAVAEAVAFGDFAGFGGVEGFEGELALDRFEEFGHGDDVLHGPAVGFADIHVFDETHDHACFAGHADEGEDFALVDAALDDGVDLDGEAVEAGGADAGEDAVHLGAHAVHGGEDLGVEGVEADRDAVQVGEGEGFGVMGEEDAVGGDGEILDALDGGEEADQIVDSPTQEGFSAGQAHLAEAQRGEGLDEVGDLLEAQNFVLGEESVVGSEDLGGHAIPAAKVAAIGDGDPQIAQWSAELVCDRIAHDSGRAIASLPGPVSNYFGSSAKSVGKER